MAATSKFMLVWLTWARGVDLPPVSALTALKNHPVEFVALFLQMASALNATVEFVPPVLPSPVTAPSRSVKTPPSMPEFEQMELFAPWDNV